MICKFRFPNEKNEIRDCLCIQDIIKNNISLILLYVDLSLLLLCIYFFFETDK